MEHDPNAVVEYKAHTYPLTRRPVQQQPQDPEALEKMRQQMKDFAAEMTRRGVVFVTPKAPSISAVDALVGGEMFLTLTTDDQSPRPLTVHRGKHRQGSGEGFKLEFPRWDSEVK